jgi:hypothetical protein
VLRHPTELFPRWWVLIEFGKMIKSNLFVMLSIKKKYTRQILRKYNSVVIEEIEIKYKLSHAFVHMLEILNSG